MVVSITRLHVRSWRFMPGFIIHTYRSMRQARSTGGFPGGRLAVELPIDFRTFTIRTDEKAMLRFRNTADHLKAMPRLLDWCHEAPYVHWQQDDSTVPTATVAFERLRDGGKLSKVRTRVPLRWRANTSPPQCMTALLPAGT
jgi:hypothetical protein